MRDDFAVFILSHGRADNVRTLKTLRDGGYTGRWYIVIDNEDDMAAEYYKRYGDHVVMFDKSAVAQKIDAGDNFDDRRAVVYARNAAYDIAEELGLRYFLQLDDDYTRITRRAERDGKLYSFRFGSFDAVFEAMLEFLEMSGAKAVAFAQGGDFVAGVHSRQWKHHITRKAMNSFFCKTDRRIRFVGKLNEDVSTYVLLGSQGHLFFTIADICIAQVPTQQGKGGITEAYREQGTYVKTFYSVMYAPSCVKVSTYGHGYPRIHHKILWNNCAPKILHEGYRKGGREGERVYQEQQAPVLSGKIREPG